MNKPFRVLCALLLQGLLCFAISNAYADADVVYWNSPEGKAMQARMSPDADFWQVSPGFSVQQTQSYCSVASAITVLNALPIKKPVDPTYAPYAYFTQRNFFTPEVSQIIGADTVLAIGMTREEMVQVLKRHGVKATTFAGDTLDNEGLRNQLQKALLDDGQFVLVNYLRSKLDQIGGGHWSVLAAYDAQADHVLILDVAKYKYTPAWISIDTLRQAIDTLDTTSNMKRGLVLVSVDAANPAP